VVDQKVLLMTASHQSAEYCGESSSEPFSHSFFFIEAPLTRGHPPQSTQAQVEEFNQFEFFGPGSNFLDETFGEYLCQSLIESAFFGQPMSLAH